MDDGRLDNRRHFGFDVYLKCQHASHVCGCECNCNQTCNGIGDR